MPRVTRIFRRTAIDVIMGNLLTLSAEPFLRPSLLTRYCGVAF
jgi:hypothetical protein